MINIKSRGWIYAELEASGIFLIRFPYKILFIIYIYVYFNCVGSHKILTTGLAFDILFVNFRTKSFLWYIYVHFDCAGSQNMLVAGLASGFL